jgi:uncharacterized phosphosugar-binding protein
MRYLITGLFFLTIGCSEHKQQSVNNNSEIDTTKLFDPNPQEGKLVESQAVLCNCLMLEEEKIAASIGCEKIELLNDKELQRLLQNNRADINKQKLYIVYSNNTANKRIIDIIAIVKAAKIDDYKVITLQSLISLNVPQE